MSRPELNIEPWANTLRDIEEKAEKVRWEDREPYAYWKGNPHVSRTRGELMQCRPNKNHDWNARLYEVVSTLLSVQVSTMNHDLGSNSGKPKFEST